MTAIERSGITIIVDTGKRRRIFNIPVASDFDIETTFEEPLPVFHDPRFMVRPPSRVESLRFSFKPLGPYTLKEEDLS